MKLYIILYTGDPTARINTYYGAYQTLNAAQNALDAVRDPKCGPDLSHLRFRIIEDYAGTGD